MFPRERRIRKSAEILQVLRTGRKSRAALLTCSYLRSTGPSRTAVIVGKKVSKLAHERNQLKRQIRALLYSQQLPSGDLIVQLLPAAQKQSFVMLQTQLSQCLRLFS